MTDHHLDFSFSTTSSVDVADIVLKNADFDSSLDSYSNLFNKDKQNFSVSSEISRLYNDDDKLNGTFTKTAKSIINIFTGKPISPNPWRKLCSKTISHQTETDIIIPAEIPSTYSDKRMIKKSISTD